MPQPAANAEIAAELTRLYAEAHARLVARFEEASTVGNERAASKIRRLIAEVRQIRRHLDTGSRTWIQTRLPVLHAAGATAAAETAGTTFAWTQGHVEAVQALAGQAWDTVAAGLQDLERSSRAALRDLARTSATSTLVEARTAKQAATDFATAAREAGFGTVTYANGAKVGIDTWAEVVTRTVTAQAYNEGTFTQGREDGFDFYEVVDGEECGWTDHDDPDLADGSIRSIDDCEQNPISHPQCARSFFPRPDITSDEEALAASSA